MRNLSWMDLRCPPGLDEGVAPHWSTMCARPLDSPARNLSIQFASRVHVSFRDPGNEDCISQLLFKEVQGHPSSGWIKAPGTCFGQSEATVPSRHLDFPTGESVEIRPYTPSWPSSNSKRIREIRERSWAGLEGGERWISGVLSLCWAS
jgi:hypothetical protein